ncbi:cupredoxin domain-containing protein [Kaarinaea lacus]
MLVNAIVVALIAFIVWWFWLAKPKAINAAQQHVIDISADDGVYEPAVIEAQAGQSITLRFLRKDANPCAEKVIFTDLDISADLTLDQTKEVTLKLDQPGEYEFTCQMGMYRGKLILR